MSTHKLTVCTLCLLHLCCATTQTRSGAGTDEQGAPAQEFPAPLHESYPDALVLVPAHRPGKEGPQGLLIPLKLRVKPNRDGKVHMAVDASLTQARADSLRASLWSAATLAAEAVGRRVVDYRIEVSATDWTTVGGSGSALLGGALMATMLRVPLKKHVTVTGSLMPHGGLGAAGDVWAEVEAAQEAGVVTFGVPAVQAARLESTRPARLGKRCATVAVTDLRQAFSLLTGQPAPGAQAGAGKDKGKGENKGTNKGKSADAGTAASPGQGTDGSQGTQANSSELALTAADKARVRKLVTSSLSSLFLRRSTLRELSKEPAMKQSGRLHLKAQALLVQGRPATAMGLLPGVRAPLYALELKRELPPLGKAKGKAKGKGKAPDLKQYQVLMAKLFEQELRPKLPPVVEPDAVGRQDQLARVAAWTDLAAAMGYLEKAKSLLQMLGRGTAGADAEMFAGEIRRSLLDLQLHAAEVHPELLRPAQGDGADPKFSLQALERATEDMLTLATVTVQIFQQELRSRLESLKSNQAVLKQLSDRLTFASYLVDGVARRYLPGLFKNQEAAARERLYYAQLGVAIFALAHTSPMASLFSADPQARSSVEQEVQQVAERAQVRALRARRRAGFVPLAVRLAPEVAVGQMALAPSLGLEPLWRAIYLCRLVDRLAALDAAGAHGRSKDRSAPAGAEGRGKGGGKGDGGKGQDKGQGKGD